MICKHMGLETLTSSSSWSSGAGRIIAGFRESLPRASAMVHGAHVGNASVMLPIHNGKHNKTGLGPMHVGAKVSKHTLGGLWLAAHLGGIRGSVAPD